MKKSHRYLSERYIPIRISRQAYLQVYQWSPAIMAMVYREGWGQVVVVDRAMLQCLLLACGLEIKDDALIRHHHNVAMDSHIHRLSN